MESPQLVTAFLKTLPTKQDNPMPCYVVGLIGLPGTGKSTFSAALSAKTGLYIASNDKIRRWLNEQGINDDEEAGRLLIEQIAVARTQLLLKRKIAHIIDGDIIRHQELLRQNVQQYSAKLFMFQLIAPERVVIERLRYRQQYEIGKQPNQLSNAGINEFNVRRQIHREVGPPESIDLLIDTTKSTSETVNRVQKYLAYRLERDR